MTICDYKYVLTDRISKELPIHHEEQLHIDLKHQRSHLSMVEAEHTESVLINAHGMGSSFHITRKRDVPFRHSFVLSEHHPVFLSARRMGPKHNNLVGKDEDVMQKAGIIKRATSAWSFPVAVTTRKDEEARFCVDNRVLNASMKADRLPLPQIPETFNEMTGASFFTTFDPF